MNIETKLVKYMDGPTICIGLLAWDVHHEGPRPCVMVAGDWRGRTAFCEGKAIELAELGYVGFAMDIYGEGRVGKNAEENATLMGPLKADRQKLKTRLLAALEAVRQIEIVDEKSVAIMGFCFGGLCALDLARSGADVKAAISFHGALTPTGLPENKITASVLALHGYDDPLATPDTIIALGEELKKAECDWQIHAYGGTLHSFMNPEANFPENGMVYNPVAAKRAWAASELLLREVFNA